MVSKDTFGPSAMHEADIKAAINKRGFTLASLARANDLSPSAVKEAIRRPGIRRAEEVIASTIGRDLWAIWPKRYRRGEAGCPERVERHLSRSRNPAHRLSTGAR